MPSAKKLRVRYARDELLSMKEIVMKQFGGPSTPVLSPPSASKEFVAAPPSVPVVRKVNKVSKESLPMGATSITSDERAQLAIVQQHFQKQMQALQNRAGGSAEEEVAEQKAEKPAVKKAWALPTGTPQQDQPAFEETVAAHKTQAAIVTKEAKGWLHVEKVEASAAIPDQPMSRSERRKRREEQFQRRPTPTRRSRSKSSGGRRQSEGLWWMNIWNYAPYYYPLIFPVAVDENGNPYDASTLPEIPFVPYNVRRRRIINKGLGKGSAGGSNDKMNDPKEDPEVQAKRLEPVKEKVLAALENQIVCLGTTTGEEEGNKTDESCTKTIKSKHRRERRQLIRNVATELGLLLKDVTFLCKGRFQEIYGSEVEASEEERANQNKIKIPKTPEEAAKRLMQRERQLNLGMRTLGYKVWQRFKELQRKPPVDIVVPPAAQICSKRSWDGQVRRWRQMLHQFDPFAAEVLTPEEIAACQYHKPENPPEKAE